mmetsp:Transcript_10757/g.14957  ORF Transcript_10757/g.14957 Transcript_10757/m.14957 type:complete len:503 (-) Transcript_10757:32-1540(-)
MLLTLVLSATLGCTGATSGKPNPRASSQTYKLHQRHTLSKGVGLLDSNADIEHLETYGRAIYAMEIGVGTPTQKVKVQIDTGSSYFWIHPKSVNENGFDESLSKTYSYNGFDRFIASYASGSVSGISITDSLEVGPYTLRDAVIGLVTAPKSYFHPYDDVVGIMGLAFEIKWGPFSSYLVDEEIAKQQHQISNFGLYLSEEDSGTNSTITFGGFELEHAGQNPAFHWTPVHYNGAFDFWRVNTHSLEYGQQIWSVDESWGPDSVVDSGSSHIVIPNRQFFDNIRNSIVTSSNGDCAFDSQNSNLGYPHVVCSASTNWDSLNALKIRMPVLDKNDVGDYELSVPAKLLFIPFKSDQRVLAVHYHKNGKYINLGAPFLRAFYTYFDKTTLSEDYICSKCTTKPYTPKSIGFVGVNGGTIRYIRSTGNRGSNTGNPDSGSNSSSGSNGINFWIFLTVGLVIFVTTGVLFAAYCIWNKLKRGQMESTHQILLDEVGDEIKEVTAEG